MIPPMIRGKRDRHGEGYEVVAAQKRWCYRRCKPILRRLLVLTRVPATLPEGPSRAEAHKFMRCPLQQTITIRGYATRSGRRASWESAVGEEEVERQSRATSRVLAGRAGANDSRSLPTTGGLRLGLDGDVSECHVGRWTNVGTMSVKYSMVYKKTAVRRGGGKGVRELHPRLMCDRGGWAMQSCASLLRVLSPTRAKAHEVLHGCIGLVLPRSNHLAASKGGWGRGFQSMISCVWPRYGALSDLDPASSFYNVRRLRWRL